MPYGVTSITIEPYWGTAVYVADQYYDVVYKNDYTGKQGVSQVGTQAVDNTTEFNGQRSEPVLLVLVLELRFTTMR